MHRGRVIWIALVLVAAAACTGGSPPRPGPSSTTPSTTPSALKPSGPSIVLDVIAATGGPDGTVPRSEVGNDSTYLEGMRVAVRSLNQAGGIGGRPVALRFHDRATAGGPTAAIGEVLRSNPTAILYVGPGPALSPMRQQLEQAHVPVILLEGDLYSSGELFREVFQTTIPWVWQVHAISRYLVLDRKSPRIAFVGAGSEAPAAAEATRSALAYWGGNLAGSFTFDQIDVGAPAASTIKEIATFNAVIDFGPSYDVHALIARLQQEGPVPRIVGGQSLLIGRADSAFPPPGSAACYTYTWAGWAEPIPRVRDFIRAYQDGDPSLSPGGFEQEGYDAVQTLALALTRTNGEGGRDLLAALEETDKTFSSFPIDLGPDDHVFLPRDEIGLFAVPGPTEKLDPWQGLGGEVWRPIMRTFTYDGERDNLIDRDRTVFFPGWKAPQPGPEYWKSRYGITTRPSDPLH